ncbi:DUF742 domain-containing protein [Pseudonocardia sp. GCM10023141]|uniref:DUF742 domain-containing protein n=1 Tax=Pseudonocardia sp. GCM10023141 TaxID=3252653 RepID=UPI00362048EE
MIVVERDDGPEVGLTGARFGGAGRRRKAKALPDTDPAIDAATDVFAVVSSPPEPAPAVGLTGARFGGATRRKRTPRAVAPLAAPAVDAPPPLQLVSPPLPGVEPEPAELVASGVAVRPYVLTGGRTRSPWEFGLETLISAVPRATPDPEHQSVFALCREPRAVAEIAALLRIPLGVARVLVGDLAAAGAVAVHRAPSTGGPDLVLMERVLGGLRRLA